MQTIKSFGVIVCLVVLCVGSITKADLVDITISSVGGTWDASTGKLHLESEAPTSTSDGSSFSDGVGTWNDGTFTVDAVLTSLGSGTWQLQSADLELTIPELSLNISKSDNPSGTFTLGGMGVVNFNFADPLSLSGNLAVDTSDHLSSGIMDVIYTSSPVPAPSSCLAGLMLLAGLGAKRVWRRRADGAGV